MEKDDEIKGNGNSYTTMFRQYEPRLGRWLSVDPKSNLFPFESPYTAMHDNPVSMTDVLGDCPECGLLREIMEKIGHGFLFPRTGLASLLPEPTQANIKEMPIGSNILSWDDWDEGFDVRKIRTEGDENVYSGHSFAYDTDVEYGEIKMLKAREVIADVYYRSAPWDSHGVITMDVQVLETTINSQGKIVSQLESSYNLHLPVLFLESVGDPYIVKSNSTLVPLDNLYDEATYSALGVSVAERNKNAPGIGWAIGDQMGQGFMETEQDLNKIEVELEEAGAFQPRPKQ